jgi:putative effector of murein hydrolase LrgA (UPF0299 family)
MMEMKRWQDWVNLLLGLWILISPVQLGFAPGQAEATWNAWVIGMGIITVFVVSGSVHAKTVWQEVANLILGLWLMVSPWLLGFATHMTARNNAVAVGFSVAALALWAMVVDTVVRKWMDDWIHEHHLTR